MTLDGAAGRGVDGTQSNRPGDLTPWILIVDKL